MTQQTRLIQLFGGRFDGAVYTIGGHAHGELWLHVPPDQEVTLPVKPIAPRPEQIRYRATGRYAVVDGRRAEVYQEDRP